MKYVLGVAIAATAMILGIGSNYAGEKKPKYTIKEVMAEAHKSGLWKKVAAGDADKADREKLAELYKSLMENKPPKGDLDEWKKTTTVMHRIAQNAIADAEAGKKLKVNCGACHKMFK